MTASPSPLDVAALKRRVLLTAVVTLALFVTATWVHTVLRVSDWWLLPVAVLLYAFVVRPMMAPVRESVALRRALAYQAFLEMREQQGQER